MFSPQTTPRELVASKSPEDLEDTSEGSRREAIIQDDKSDSNCCQSMFAAIEETIGSVSQPLLLIFFLMMALVTVVAVVKMASLALVILCGLFTLVLGIANVQSCGCLGADKSRTSQHDLVETQQQWPIPTAG